MKVAGLADVDISLDHNDGGGCFHLSLHDFSLRPPLLFVCRALAE
jgi:hypothetical protein